MNEQIDKPRRWDPLVKLTHWGIVAAVIGNALVTEEGSGWHIWVGYGLAALLGLRLLWGLIGSVEARFSAFPPSPARAIAHLQDIRSGTIINHRSHNPLGALMVYAIWATLLTITASGIAMAGPPPADPAAVTGERGGESDAENDEGEAERVSLGELVIGPAKADEGRGEQEGGESEDWLAEVHEVAVNLLYVLIALHLAGVIFETRRAGPQVVGAMLPGRNRRG